MTTTHRHRGGHNGLSTGVPGPGPAAPLTSSVARRRRRGPPRSCARFHFTTFSYALASAPDIIHELKLVKPGFLPLQNRRLSHRWTTATTFCSQPTET